MKRWYCFFISFLFCVSCETYLTKKVSIPKSPVFVEMGENDPGAIYHVYFENLDERDKSAGYNLIDLTSDTLKVFPGRYHIYFYGLKKKNEKSYCVDSFQKINDQKISYQQAQNVQFYPDRLFPDFEVQKGSDNQMLVKINMQQYYDVYYVSSMSVKQGSDRTRSVKPVLDKEKECYDAFIDIIQKAEWYLNISFGLKSKRDKTALEQDNISISTTYFKEIILTDLQSKNAVYKMDS